MDNRLIVLVAALIAIGLTGCDKETPEVVAPAPVGSVQQQAPTPAPAPVAVQPAVPVPQTAVVPQAPGAVPSVPVPPAGSQVPPPPADTQIQAQPTTPVVPAPVVNSVGSPDTQSAPVTTIPTIVPPPESTPGTTQPVVAAEPQPVPVTDNAAVVVPPSTVQGATATPPGNLISAPSNQAIDVAAPAVAVPAPNAPPKV